MKCNYLIGIFILTVLLANCNDGPIPSSERPVLPVLPDDWSEILGEANWRLEWIGDNGIWHKYDLKTGAPAPGLNLPLEWTTPVIAWPFWPERDLFPGMMHPAGALFPWDARGNNLVLSWKGGVDAVFWRELALADRTSTKAEGRLPWFFDWPRFRELMQSDDINALAKQDPWVVDWKEVSRKTVESGFDRRRITSRKFKEIEIPDLKGRWVSSSPFSASLTAPKDGPLVLAVSDAVCAWISADGILKCSTSGWIYRDW
jgi:hypothetical protein